MISYCFAGRWLRRLSLLLGLGAAQALAFEAGVVQLPVPDQSVEARQAAFTAGLEEVLGRIGGDLAELDESQRAGLIEQGREYITSYRYLNQEGGWQLEVRFDAQALEERLKQKGVAVVIEQRPQTLVWLALEQSHQRQLLADGSALAQKFAALGAQQAAPLVFPVLDLDDFQNLDTAEVWGLFEQPILSASSRYQAPSVLAGRIYVDGDGRYQGQWLYLYGARRHRQAVDADTLDAALAEGARLVAAQLTEQLLSNQQRSGAAMQVEFVGVESTAAYAELLSLVRSLAPVRQVKLAAMEPEVVRLQLTIDTAPEVVEQLLARQLHLKPVAAAVAPAPAAGESAVIALPRFGWQGS